MHSRSRKVLALKVDFKQVFGKIWKEGLAVKLRRCCIHGNMKRLYKLIGWLSGSGEPFFASGCSVAQSGSGSSPREIIIDAVIICPCVEYKNNQEWSPHAKCKKSTTILIVSRPYECEKGGAAGGV